MKPFEQSDHSKDDMFRRMLSNMEILLIKRGLWLAAIKMFQNRHEGMTQEHAVKALAPYADLIARRATDES